MKSPYFTLNPFNLLKHIRLSLDPPPSSSSLSALSSQEFHR
jgi:hypothetical protein